MKTPRKILLSRHEGAVPHLDQIRQSVIHSIGEVRRPIGRILWEELILPVRRAWIGIAVAWMVVIALNLLTGKEAQAGLDHPAPMAPESVMALQRQEQLITQAAETDSEPAKAHEEQPRSEALTRQKVV